MALAWPGWQKRFAESLERLGASLPDRIFLIASGLAGSGIFFFVLISTPLEWQTQAWLGMAMMVTALVMNRLSNAHWATLAMASLSIFMTGRYAYWRVTETLGLSNPSYPWLDLGFTLLLFGAELYAWLVLLLGYIQTAQPLGRKPIPLAADFTVWPTVDIYIPTYNEPLDVVRPTVVAALNIDWPRDRLRVYILDDGTRDEFRRYAAETGAGYIVRSEHKHAKAGNLNHAMTQTDGEYIAIFDCDHVPVRSFLQVTLGWMEKHPRLGLLQTPHHFYSPDPFERNLQLFRKIPNEGELFYGIVQDGNDLWDATFFCGSCAVIRRTALEEVGGIAVETVTEDAHTALKMHRRGWETAYLNVPQAAGLATESLSGHVGQRIRWARGMAQIFRVDNPLLGRGLKLGQRLCYLNAMLHFFFAVPRLIFLTAPLAFLFFGLRVIDAYALAIAAYAVPHLLLASMTNSRIQGRYRYSFWNEVYETVLAPYILLPTILAVINPKLGKFNVTAKGGLVPSTYFDTRIAKPFLLLWWANAVGIAAGGYRLWAHVGDMPTIVMGMIWTLFNLLILSAGLAVAQEQKQVRHAVRVTAALPVRVFRRNGEQCTGTSIDISEGGMRIDAPEKMAFAPDEWVVVGVQSDEAERHLPARVLDMRNGQLRLRFPELNTEQYKHLVMILYARADAWVTWGEGRADDRPLHSLGLLARMGLRGAGMMLQNLFADAAQRVGLLRAARGVAVLLLVALSCLLASPVSRAQAVEAASPSMTPTPLPGTFTRAWSLLDLGYANGLRLAGVNGMQRANFSLSEDRVPAQAVLELHYRVSPGLLERLSQVNIFLNGNQIASLPVVRGTAGAELVENIPINPLLLATYNHLDFQLIGHYTLQCEDPSNSTLWAQVQPNTRLIVSGHRLQLPDRIDLLPAPFFYKASQEASHLPSFVFFGSRRDPGVLEAAGIVASWFGMLADYRKTRFPVSNAVLPGGNAVLFVTPQDVLPQGLHIPNIQGPALAIRSNPADSYGKLLLIMGRTPDEIRIAAQALTLGQYVLAGADAQVRSFQLPAPRKPDDAPRWANTHRPIPFGQLTSSERLEVRYSGQISLPLRLPPDLFFWDIKRIPLRLHYAYNPAPIGAQSTLNLSLNDHFSNAEALRPAPITVQAQRSTFYLPPDWFVPFENTLGAHFYFQIVKQGYCKDVVLDNFRGTLLPDSTLDLTDIPHYARLPNLGLFVNGAYPYTRYADLAQTAVVLPDDPSDVVLSAYLEMVGQFGRATGYPGLRIQVVRPAHVGQAADKDLLILGTPFSQPLLRQWQAHLPIVQTENGVEVHDLRNFIQRSTPFGDENRPSEDKGYAGLGRLAARGELPRLTLQAIESPLRAGRLALFVTGRSDQLLAEAGQLPFESKLRPDIFGDVSVFDEHAVHSYILQGPRYSLGTLPWSTWVRYQIYRHPWLMWVMALGASLLLGVLLSVALKRRVKQRLDAGS